MLWARARCHKNKKKEIGPADFSFGSCSKNSFCVQMQTNLSFWKDDDDDERTQTNTQITLFPRTIHGNMTKAEKSKHENSV